MDNGATDNDETVLPPAAPGAPSGSPHAVLERRFGDRYRVGRLLGEGGQKRVYLARDARLDRDVVIATLKTDGLDEDGLTRLHHEARALGRLGDHPHIVSVYDLIEERGQALLVAQYVDGGTLRVLRKRNPNGRLPVDEVIRIGAQIAEALQHAHRNGIVHRDVKPGNIWLTQDGTAKLGDFGLAAGLSLSDVTAEGTLLGTVAYMAPEQAVGRMPAPEGDLYSLGVVLYELVTGRRPFDGDSVAAIVSQHLYVSPVPPSCHAPDIPAPLERVILRLLAKNAADRFADAQAVAHALAAVRSTPEPAGRDARRVSPLDRLAAGVFVGRAAELDRMKAAVEDAVAGRGGIVALVGDPGSGKTATAEQLLTYSRLRGADVIRARGFEGEGAPAYWPWVQVLRALTADRPAFELRSRLGAGAGVIAQLDPELALRVAPASQSPALEPAQARFRLFDTVAAFLTEASASRPLVILVDDVHWADAASLLLLQFLAREIRKARLLLLVTCREMPLERQHPLAQALGALSTVPGYQRIVLGGLSESDVARFVEIAMGDPPSPSLVKAVHAEAEGNPFFVTEIVRLLVTTEHFDPTKPAESWRITLPQGVRDLVNQRLAYVSAEAIDALSVASIVGREFELRTVEKALERPTAHSIHDLLDEAVAARLVHDDPEAAGRYRFSHALIRETLYDGLGMWRRVHLHQRIGEALEALHEGDIGPHVAELAYHFAQTIALGHPEKAIQYAIHAAERADAMLAYEEATNQYATALRGFDALSPPDRPRRCDVLLARGAAETKAGFSDAARESFQQAVTLAREAGLVDSFARAALGLGSGTSADRTAFSGWTDHTQVALLREALDRIGDGNEALRARLVSQLALALYRSPTERARYSQEAVDLARRSQDPGAQLAALFSRCVALLGFDRTEERLELAREIVDVADRIGDKEMSLRGRYRCLRERMELGDIPGVERELDAYAHLASQVRQPRHSWYVPFCEASLALFRGHFDECDRLTAAATAVGRRAQDVNVAIYCGILSHTADWLRGRFEESAKLLGELIKTHPAVQVGNRVILARLYCFMGRTDDARREFDALAASQFADAPVDGGRVTYICSLATTCAWLRDGARAELLYPLVAEFRTRNVLAGNPAVCGGPVAQYLAGLASVRGRWDEANGLYLEAIDKNTRMGARPWLALALCGHARMLLARRQPGDVAAARDDLEHARAIGSQLQMAWVMSWTAEQLAASGAQ